MARTTPSDPGRGNTLRGIAIASAVIYTVFTVIATSGGSESSYQTPLWATWLLVMLVAAATFAIGAAMHRAADNSVAGAAERTPTLTLVN
jgi:hypothetical protein